MGRKILIFKRRVKYLRLEIDLENIKIIVPKGIEIDEKRILEKYRSWIKNKIIRLNEIKKISENLKIYIQDDLNGLIDLFVNEIGEILNVKPEKILFRKMKRRWGSCNYKKKVLILNKLLQYLPEELIKYIVIHEMCHLIIKNHKKEFWLLVKKFDPNFKEKEKLLAGYRLKLNLI
jgi:predicted metal-dependent hydrolase